MKRIKLNVKRMKQVFLDKINHVWDSKIIFGSTNTFEIVFYMILILAEALFLKVRKFLGSMMPKEFRNDLV